MMIFTVELDVASEPPIGEVRLYLDREGVRFLQTQLAALKVVGRYVWEEHTLGPTAVSSGTRIADRLTVSYHPPGLAPQSSMDGASESGRTTDDDPDLTVELGNGPDHLIRQVEMHLGDRGLDQLLAELGRFKETGDHAHFFGEGWGGWTLGSNPRGTNSRTVDHLRVTYVEGLTEAEREEWRNWDHVPLTERVSPPKLRTSPGGGARFGRR